MAAGRWAGPTALSLLLAVAGCDDGGGGDAGAADGDADAVPLREADVETARSILDATLPDLVGGAGYAVVESGPAFFVDDRPPTGWAFVVTLDEPRSGPMAGWPMIGCEPPDRFVDRHDVVLDQLRTFTATVEVNLATVVLLGVRPPAPPGATDPGPGAFTFGERTERTPWPGLPCRPPTSD